MTFKKHNMTFKVSEALWLRLKISVWVVDENRYSDLAAKKPNSVIWQTASLVWVCYLNACRYDKVEPIDMMAEIELRVDELYSTKDGKKYLADLTSEITKEIAALSETYDSTDEKKSQIPVKTKKQIGRK